MRGVGPPGDSGLGLPSVSIPVHGTAAGRKSTSLPKSGRELTTANPSTGPLETYAPLVAS